MFAWLILAGTILLEVVGSTMMKLSQGFTVFWPSVGVFVCYSAALAGLTITLKYIELSIAYAIWAGAGTALIAVIGIAYFREPVSALKIVSLILVVAGVVGLQLSSNHTST
ncbi:MAG: multidrug efflux SMR transporter [Pseudomonadota bacterium]